LLPGPERKPCVEMSKKVSKNVGKGEHKIKNHVF